MDYRVVEELAFQNEKKIVLLVMDGVGGLQMPGREGTELHVARIPNLNLLARQGSCGLMDPIMPGVTPGSGPAHFALFGYDPVENNIGRGVLEAAGIGMELTPDDVAVRINFATIDEKGNIVDRRAGRIPTEECERLCKKLQEKVDLGPDVQFIIKPVKEHRAMIVLRGKGLSGDLLDTDPQQTGVPALPATPAVDTEEARRTAKIVDELVRQVKEILADEPKANFILLRGFAKNRHYRSMEERFKLRAYAIANYPMYRGVAKLVGMKLHPITPDVKTEFEALREVWNDHDFFFLHVKYTDSRGEDGDFDAKVKIIEEVDSYIPMITELNPDVLVVTGDHSTPAVLKSHSWHPVPVILAAPTARMDDVERFDEVSCAKGTLGRFPTVELMSLMLAHALRLKKFGA